MHTFVGYQTNEDLRRPNAVASFRVCPRHREHLMAAKEVTDISQYEREALGWIFNVHFSTWVGVTLTMANMVPMANYIVYYLQK